ncbi:MAG: flagellar motor switch protein FliM, partial [Nitrospirae bacterium]|nr:flagellar motor switch protein FliM [Nitrospirota bacterium]
ELDQRWVERLKDILMGSKVKVTTEMGQSVLMFGELMRLQVGDVITLNRSTTDELLVKVEDVPKFKGLPGFSRGNQAVRVTKVLG